MKRQSICILIAYLLVAVPYTAVGEVAKLEFGTDASWKCLDFENEGWTSVDYDDSWWESAVDRGWNNGNLGNSPIIWYPGEITENTIYFRYSFDVPGSDIVYGILDVGMKNQGTIELYLNDNPIGTVKANCGSPERLYIATYLAPGKNVIAAKVTVPVDSDYWGWGLNGLVRYNN